MSTQSNKNPINKLISVAGFASASILLSFPAFALIPTSSTESNGKTQELLAQRSSDQGDSSGTLQSQQGGMGNQSPRPEGDQVVPTAPSPSDPSVDEVTPADPAGQMEMENNQMQMNEPPSARESNDNDGNRMNQPASASETNDNDGNSQYSSDTDRLRPGTWLCLNNPNPQCES
jgi:hypothetical protein